MKSLTNKISKVDQQIRKIEQNQLTWNSEIKNDGQEYKKRFDDLSFKLNAISSWKNQVDKTDLVKHSKYEKNHRCCNSYKQEHDFYLDSLDPLFQCVQFLSKYLLVSPQMSVA